MRILYDHTLSTRGVLLATGRKPRAKDPFDFQAGPLFSQAQAPYGSTNKTPGAPQAVAAEHSGSTADDA